jgi:hypothetical protein
MKKANSRWVLIIVVIMQLIYSCSPGKVIYFNNELRQDTVTYAGTASYLGPYYIKLGEPRSERNKQERLLSSKQENQDIMSFVLCGKEDCAEAESYFYTKTKTPFLVSGENGSVARVKSEKLYGSIRFNKQDTMTFMVDVGGKRPGKGFLTLPDNGIITIEPISKRSTYGKRAYRVGLEFKRNGKAIGGFIQAGEMIEVVLKQDETERMKLVLSALAVSLVNRSNEIRIL